jgi:hypothetical protein
MHRYAPALRSSFGCDLRTNICSRVEGRFGGTGTVVFVPGAVVVVSGVVAPVALSNCDHVTTISWGAAGTLASTAAFLNVNVSAGDTGKSILQAKCRTCHGLGELPISGRRKSSNFRKVLAPRAGLALVQRARSAKLQLS